ncbi:MAG: hypothetical protein FJ387_12045 [Verrucomicrobia bacterium]|nr:hypothetical protein [Verrucomicrobiota bacterium]
MVDICEHRRKCYANQSGWRLDKAMSHYYTWQIARSRLDGTSEKDTFAEIEKAAGLPIPATDTQRLARYKAYQERRRSKLGLLPQ